MPDNDPVAPKKGQNVPDQGTSFETYFLRDLYHRGKVDEAFLRKFIADEGLNIPVNDVIGAIKDTSGATVPPELHKHLQTLAESVSKQN